MGQEEQAKYGGNFERAIFCKNDTIYPRENARYEWAKKNLVGKKILEIGCTNGYGVRYFKDIPGVEYIGVDYDQGAIDLANKEYGNIPGVKFLRADIHEFPFEQYDTIIAMEVLEHVTDGKEIAQKLKKHCKCLLATSPYKEPTGFWGCHHVLLGLTEKDFPNFNIKFIDYNCQIQDKPDTSNCNLMLMKWEKKTVTAEISTKDRHKTTLPFVLVALTQQTVLPDRIMIFDDSDNPPDMREDPLYQYIFGLIQLKGIQWSVTYGEKKGQTLNHQKVLTMTDTDFIWRLDDDNYPEPNALEVLLDVLRDEKIGAAGCLVWHTNGTIFDKPSFVKGSITPTIEFAPVEWFRHKTMDNIKVEHLYSTFLFRRQLGIDVGGYPMDLSPIGHHEETTFSYKMHRAGYDLVVTPRAVIYHFRYPTGGIRNYSQHEMWDSDDRIFRERLKNWGVDTRLEKTYVLDCGIGDHYAFKMVLSELREKYPECKIVIACCYPEVFEDEKDIKIVSIWEIKIMLGDIEKYNVYKYCIDNNWKGTLSDAFRDMYVEGKAWK